MPPNVDLPPPYVAPPAVPSAPPDRLVPPPPLLAAPDAADWNATLARHPQAVLATFVAAQSTTWLGLYAALTAAGPALPPSLAAGWLIAKASKKFRQPVNAGMAALLVRGRG